MVLLGEQPGDAEDRRGRPLVGPAGKLLDKALEEACVNRASVYFTNVVKHFQVEAARKTTNSLKAERPRYYCLPPVDGSRVAPRSAPGAGLSWCDGGLLRSLGQASASSVNAADSEPLHSCPKR
jgi:Uracil DNA glycosylase superfamily